MPKVREHGEAGMERSAKQKRTSDSEIDSDEEIWKTIRHLDPDRGLRTSDIVTRRHVDTVCHFALRTYLLASPLKLMSTGKWHEHRVGQRTDSLDAKSVGTFKELFLREDSSTFARPAYEVDLQNEAAGYHSMITKRH